ncbi:hypothetical protein Q428_10825 [Fervidicella metallireducens AeB]|uniref:Uncharacterized protein n=1 Tax=Fervidicella metallireducens AeB TaxID=1403537 RepID=A0A017RVH4_9CLOT|nr:hypothetical protein [Fervidicella metallireducens]EYE87910.1 hypothetical protein Q428_10825 [Fervidicella metallireducens AeB]
MSQTIIEYLREQSVNNLFAAGGFCNNWNTWQSVIQNLAPSKTARQILNLGDNLSNIFSSTRSAGRTQSDVSGGGASWEALVCWYLNLCLIGRRTVVIKHSKKLIPNPVSDAITVNYANFVSNTESDLIAITFPHKDEYIIDKDLINIFDADGNNVAPKTGTRYNLIQVLDALTHRDFSNIEIHIIQCKTNWNDNAQIPMLWDMIYSANNFRNNITVGRNGYSIHNILRFTYSFVTVPTVDITKIKATSTCVKRVSNISGGNYWGRPTRSNIASSVKEMLARNLASGHTSNHLTTLNSELPKLSNEYNYFKL